MDDLDHISFAEWLVQLNKTALDLGFKDENFSAATGQLEWFCHYEAGLTPEAAIHVARIEALEYGSLYEEI